MLLIIRAIESEIAVLGGVCGTLPGAIVARLFGRDYIDAMFGAVYGALIGYVFWLALPNVQ